MQKTVSSKFLHMKNVRRNNCDRKKYIVLFGLIFIFHNAFGEIKNGYGNDIVQLNESLKNLKAIVS